MSCTWAVSVTGVTGARASLAGDLPAFLARIRKHTDVPVAVGFGVSKREHVLDLKKHGAEGAVVGSAIINAIQNAGSTAERVAAVKKLVKDLTTGPTPTTASDNGVQPRDTAEVEKRP